MKFRKKPVEIDAFQWHGEYNTFDEWLVSLGYPSTDDADPDDNGPRAWMKANDSCLYIETLEGTMTAQEEDWIIRGVAGEFYPCKPVIFIQTYDVVRPQSVQDAQNASGKATL